MAEHREQFCASFLTSEALAPIASATELIADFRSRPAWDGALIEAEHAQFPRITVDWHDGRGFILHCWEDETSGGDFLVTRREFSTPSVDVELGGQALERWPCELFSSTADAIRAIDYFLMHGAKDPCRVVAQQHGSEPNGQRDEMCSPKRSAAVVLPNEPRLHLENISVKIDHKARPFRERLEPDVRITDDLALEAHACFRKSP